MDLQNPGHKRSNLRCIPHIHLSIPQYRHILVYTPCYIFHEVEYSGHSWLVVVTTIQFGNPIRHPQRNNDVNRRLYMLGTLQYFEVIILHSQSFHTI